MTSDVPATDVPSEIGGDRLFVTQAISSPKVSVARGPSAIEDRDGSALTNWIMGLDARSDINIIMRDFIDRNAPSVAHMMRLNVLKSYVVDTAQGPSLNALLNPDIRPAQITYYRPFGTVAISGSALAKLSVLPEAG